MYESRRSQLWDWQIRSTSHLGHFIIYTKTHSSFKCICVHTIDKVPASRPRKTYSNII
jgi:hypothetical protein